MNPLQHIRGTIEQLNRDNVEDKKAELLALFDAFAPSNGNGESGGKHHRLSPREREVMEMILGGQRLKEIAARLEISVKTVTTHRARLLRKLGVEDNLNLYRYGVRHGLINV